MPDTDGQLYIRFLNENDEEAFNCLFDRYNEGLMLFLYEIVGDREDAKELMMDTFAVLSSRRANFKEREGSTFKTWLFKIAKNIALKHLRKRRHVFFEVFDDKKLDTALTTEEPEAVILEEERKKRLYRALSELNADYRQVLYLKYFEGLNADEISKIMRKTKKQVYRLTEHGKEAIKIKMEEIGDLWDM